MTTIYLIRHGQASAGAENYDVLSPIGRKQAAILGDHLRDISLEFDGIYSGSLERQIDTATIATGITSEQLRIKNNFNEYHHSEIFSYYLPLLAKKNKMMADAAGAGPNTLMTMEVFTALMNAWTQDNSDQAESIESWPQFKNRISAGLKEITASHGPKDKVAIFTSGGVICTILQSVFNTTPQLTFEMNWGINNASMSRVKLKDEKIHLREYNNTAHLALQQDNTLITQI